MPGPNGLHRLIAVALSAAAVFIIGCEGIVTGTETPSGSPVSTEQTSGTGVPATVDSVVRTPVSGGRPSGTPIPEPATPTATAASTPAGTRTLPTAVAPAQVGSGTGKPTRTNDALQELDRFAGGQLVGVDDLALALLVTADRSFDSICNPSAEGGSAFGETSIFNDASQYGGPFGANSPFNPDSTAPPRIFVEGVFVGHLSVSPFVADPVDPSALLTWLGCSPSP